MCVCVCVCVYVCVCVCVCEVKWYIINMGVQYLCLSAYGSSTVSNVKCIWELNTEQCKVHMGAEQ